MTNSFKDDCWYVNKIDHTLRTYVHKISGNPPDEAYQMFFERKGIPFHLGTVYAKDIPTMFTPYWDLDIRYENT